MNDSENKCPVCGALWEDHDFGVPHPFCPKDPLPGKSWYPKKKSIFLKLKEKFIEYFIKNN